MNTLEVWIGQHFAPALVNGDPSGLSDGEENDFLQFVEDVRAKTGNFYEEVLDETDEFGVCEVTGLRGAVVKVRFHAVQTH